MTSAKCGWENISIEFTSSQPFWWFWQRIRIEVRCYSLRNPQMPNCVTVSCRRHGHGHCDRYLLKLLRLEVPKTFNYSLLFHSFSDILGWKMLSLTNATSKAPNSSLPPSLLTLAFLLPTGQISVFISFWNKHWFTFHNPLYCGFFMAVLGLFTLFILFGAHESGD